MSHYSAHKLSAGNATRYPGKPSSKSSNKFAGKNAPHKIPAMAAGRASMHRDGEVKIHVCNLPFSTSNNHLAQVFEAFGEVLEAFVFKRPNPKNGTRSAIIRMASATAAHEAIASVHGYTWNGQVLRVRLSVHNETALAEEGSEFEAPSSLTPTVPTKIARRAVPALTIAPPSDFTTDQATSSGSRSCSTTRLGSARLSLGEVSSSSSSDSFTFDEPVSLSAVESTSSLKCYVHNPYDQRLWASMEGGMY